LVAKIKYYLENENQRIEISKNAYSFVSEFHTYENRFDKLFNNLSNTLLKEDLFVENDE
jgi:spore maturation protein CgeB